MGLQILGWYLPDLRIKEFKSMNKTYVEDNRISTIVSKDMCANFYPKMGNISIFTEKKVGRIGDRSLKAKGTERSTALNNIREGVEVVRERYSISGIIMVIVTSVRLQLQGVDFILFTNFGDDVDINSLSPIERVLYKEYGTQKEIFGDEKAITSLMFSDRLCFGRCFELEANTTAPDGQTHRGWLLKNGLTDLYFITLPKAEGTREDFEFGKLSSVTTWVIRRQDILNYLKKQGYPVMKLIDVCDAMKEGRSCLKDGKFFPTSKCDTKKLPFYFVKSVVEDSSPICIVIKDTVLDKIALFKFSATRDSITVLKEK
jgi:hypothetical protein